MKCLSCGYEARGNELKFLEGLALCSGCHALAQNIQQKIDAEIETARKNCYAWLHQHVLKGGLLRGQVPSRNEVRGVWRQEKHLGTSGSRG